MEQNKALTFEFVSVEFNEKNGEACFDYAVNFLDGKKMEFREKMIFPIVGEVKVKNELLHKAIRDLHIVVGVSYYKLYCPEKFVLKYDLSLEQANFWNKLYLEGLGEFIYKNKLNPKRMARFIGKKSVKSTALSFDGDGRVLLGVGGGKESAVAAEILKENKEDVTAFVLETKPSSVIDEEIKVMGLPSLKITRKLDEKLFEKLPDTFNGHIPISAIIAFAGYFLALLNGFSKVVVGNEFSSNFGNVRYRGLDINHQWSKSSEFEDVFGKYVKDNLTSGVEYFSILRPFYEIRIAKMFARYPQYFSVISSCNRNFRIKEDAQKKWCGQCAKCAFVFTLFSAFLSKKKLFEIFGENLYENKNILPLFKDLLGIGDLKPFDCVGTFSEMRAAFLLANKKFATSYIQNKLKGAFQLNKKEFETLFRYQKSNLKPPYLFYGINNVLLVGYAKEGIESKKYIHKKYQKIKVSIADKKFGDDYLKKQDDYDLAIKTAGMPGRLISVPYTTATNIFFGTFDNKKIIGVTGSKGKSTTASLISWILNKGGINTLLAGNIGIPAISILRENIDKDAYVVLELSSYQLEDIKFSPHVAVVTNLFPEHMDYHGSENAYYGAKKNIINFQNSDDVFVFNQKDKRLLGWSKKSTGKAVGFSEDIPLDDAFIPLLGEHNRSNIKAAVAVARLFNISDEKIGEAIRTFKPLRHRLQKVGIFREITFFDDAISTTPESTIQALKALGKVDTIFLGGLDRGYDFTLLRKALLKHGVRNVVLFPETGEKIVTDKKTFDKVLKTKSMKEAVDFAFKYTKKKGVCLLSTASPSYSVWKDFEEKGDLFQKEVLLRGK